MIFFKGKLSHEMDEWDKALIAFESALRLNPTSQKSLHSLARLLLEREQFSTAAEVFQRLLSLGKYGKAEEVMAEMGMCWLGMEELGKAGTFIQKAFQLGVSANDANTNANTSNTTSTINTANTNTNTNTINAATTNTTVQHSPSLWYTLGVYHDRLANEEAAIDAFLAFIESERVQGIEVSDRGREVYYRLGVLYRLNGKLKEARECFDFVRRQLLFCTRPGISAQNQIIGPCKVEVLVQLALIDESEGEVRKARISLENLLMEVSSSGGSLGPLYRARNLIPKIRQKLGCLALTLPTVFENDSSALAQLLKATEEDPQDALNWYYLGRLYLQLRQPTKAYDAYQQAVYRDGRNASFWNSIGLLYFGIGQFRDSLDAFTRAVHHAPHSRIIWWNLGLLYESCHGKKSEDAREAFQKGLEYSRSKNDQPMLTKFEEKLEEDSVPKREGEPEGTPMDQTIETDANRFVLRHFSAFPRPQSAASMSRFLTYRGQQAVQQSQARRSIQPIVVPQTGGYSFLNRPPSMMTSFAGPSMRPMRPKPGGVFPQHHR